MPLLFKPTVGIHPIEKIVKRVEAHTVKKRRAPYVINGDLAVPMPGTATEKDNLKDTLADSVEVHTPIPDSTSNEAGGQTEQRKWWSE